jgi:hypothetical protein
MLLQPPRSLIQEYDGRPYVGYNADSLEWPHPEHAEAVAVFFNQAQPAIFKNHPVLRPIWMEEKLSLSNNILWGIDLKGQTSQMKYLWIKHVQRKEHGTFSPRQPDRIGNELHMLVLLGLIFPSFGHSGHFRSHLRHGVPT